MDGGEGGLRSGRPKEILKPETRSPKEIRNPKSEQAMLRATATAVG
jgi:hypothetical protein